MDPLILLVIGIATVVGGIMGLRLHAFLALILAAMVVGSLTPRSSLERYAVDKKMSPAATETFLGQRVGERVAGQFGNTCASVGILIALASVIGRFLLESGAADRIVRSLMRLLGEPRAPLAFLGSGYLLAVPIFFDTVFYLLMPLGKALRLRTGKNYVLYVLTIIAGTTMSHSLVPPTPGPLYVATQLNVTIGYMMIGGLVVGAITCFSGFLYAVWLNRRMDVPLRDTADATVAQLAATSQRDERELPGFWMAILPILLPVVLIGGHAILNMLFTEASKDWSLPMAEWPRLSAALAALIEAFKYPSETMAGVLRVSRFLGDPNFALLLATGASFALLLRHRPANARPISTVTEEALTGGGLIILITAAGGAFGGMLQQTGVGHSIEGLAREYRIGILPLAWAVTVLIRTAQGSATVAMFTAVGILGGMVATLDLGFHPVYVALAIGCGSKPFPWMNDSGFWLITKMSGMTIGETIKSFSVMQVVMATTGLITVMVLSRLFPLV